MNKVLLILTIIVAIWTTTTVIQSLDNPNQEIIQNQQTIDINSNNQTAKIEPSFICDKANNNSVENTICQNDELSALDNELAITYKKAYKKSANQTAKQSPANLLQAEQRGWIKGRDECWKNDDQASCIKNEYIRRTAELQAQYRLVAHTQPARFICDNDPTNEFMVVFFETTPSTLIAERGDSVSLMYIQPSASGSKYQGANESFWEHQGEALITWGVNQSKLRCVKAR
ncbi:MliC family protein [Colwellia echini]|uniref:DUF1311 domain-containing protein n=1 Tax=Colwellia echini TaxID=1982103 RepID=A0ABY3N169_9GAMM|nr:MliC family protein [Colwellia echini]TYK67059.1 DUF1311 domain-containing protein [Colwellia echini]